MLLFIFTLCISVCGLETDDSQRRVIIEISRGSIVTGKVISQDDETIVIQDRDGETITIELDGISRIVRLVEGGDEVTGFIHLVDGRSLHGTIILDDYEKVVAEIHGITLRFTRNQVDRVSIDPPFEETYKQLLQSLDLTHPPHLQMFVSWLLDRNQLDLAEVHLKESTLDTPLINLLRTQTTVRIKARDNPLQAKLRTNNEDDPSDSLDVGRVLTEEEVHLIRAYEVDLRHPSELTIPDETRTLLLEKYSEDPRMQAGSNLRRILLKGSDQDAFRVLRLLRGEEYYKGIRVKNAPESLRLFSKDVHDEWLISSCGTLACHGSVGAGRFYLRRKPRNSDLSRYANLLMLERLVVDPSWPIINFDTPAQSLFLQYALPRDLADHPHPDVKKWKPVRSLERKKVYQAALTWIRSMRQVPRPEYPIEFKLTPLPTPSPEVIDPQ